MNPRVFVTRVAVASLVAVPLVLAQSSDEKHEVRIDLDHLSSNAPAPAKPVAPTSAAQHSTAAASTTKPAAAGAAQADEAQPKIDGMAVSRGELGYLGVKIEDNRWKITFYDQDKKPKPADVASIVLRWPVHYQPNDERAELQPSADGMAMVSSKVVRAPFTFKLYMTLLRDTNPGADAAPEIHVIDFSQ